MTSLELFVKIPRNDICWKVEVGILTSNLWTKMLLALPSKSSFQTNFYIRMFKMDAILLRLLRNLHLFTVQIGIVRHFNWDLSSSYMDIFNFSHVYGHGFLYGLQLALSYLNLCAFKLWKLSSWIFSYLRWVQKLRG